MTRKELLKRYTLFIIGLFINALGVSFITRASLGTSPISSMPYTLSMGFPLTMGEFTFLLNIVLIIGQIIILKKEFQKIQLIQIPVSILFGYFIDLTMSLLSFIHPTNYILKISSLLFGCAILGFGVSIEVIANVVMLSGEAFVKAIATKFKREFGTTKICFDVTLTICACIISMIMFNRIAGVREGTVIAALIVGLIAKFFNKHLAFIDNILCGDASTVITAINGDLEAQQEVAALQKINTLQESKNKIIITIGHQFGSGGHEIGEKLAKELNIAFYDREIIKITAQESGYSENYIEDHEEKLTNSILYDLVTQPYAYTKDMHYSLDDLFAAESKVIKEIASKESCVIVGRCSDYVLKDMKELKRIFVHANEKSRIERIAKQQNLSNDEAKTKVHKNDRKRENYYKQFTGKEMDKVQNYNLAIDTSVFGVDKAINMIRDWALSQR
jgi:uncharacterized membrane protein YczE/cytidylate kinase